MNQERTNRRRGEVAIGAALLALLGACGSESASDESPRFTARPEISAEGSRVYLHDNLPEMATASAYVVRGRVINAGPGRSVGTPGADLLTYRTVTLEVLEVVKGSVGSGDELEFEEEGYETDGTGYVMNGVQWSYPGDEAWYFLRKDPEGILHLTSDRGRFGINGSDLGPSGFDLPDHNPWKGIRKAEVAEKVRGSAGRSRR